jgi:2'-5' RNA ligase
LAQAVASAQAGLAGEPIRWVRVDILHLTLRFLGETAPATIERVLHDAGERARSWRVFDLRVRSLGCFPDASRPRVIWAGAAEESGRLAEVARDLERVARDSGLPAEERPFSPHLTLGRVRDRLSAEGGRRLAGWIGNAGSEEFGAVHVRSIELYRSDLRPGGPVYTRLASLALGA